MPPFILPLFHQMQGKDGLINRIRGFSKTFGQQFPKNSTGRRYFTLLPVAGTSFWEHDGPGWKEGFEFESVKIKFA